MRRSPTHGRERPLCWLALTRWFLRKPPRLAARGLESALKAVGREDAAAYVRRPRQLVGALRTKRR